MKFERERQGTEERACERACVYVCVCVGACVDIHMFSKIYVLHLHIMSRRDDIVCTKQQVKQ